MSQPSTAIEMQDHEAGIALRLTGVILIALTVAKTLGGVPWLGTVLISSAVLLQLYIPLWRTEVHEQPLAWIGLHTQRWRQDLKVVALLILISFPLYGAAYHLYMTNAHRWIPELQWGDTLYRLPQYAWQPEALFAGNVWTKTLGGLEVVATHLLGVALPEETFYRGYLQPQLQQRWPALKTVFGVPFGRAAVLATFFFAIGHFLGEWHPWRLLPFFPGLIFAWQRNHSGSVLGCILFHASCNLFSILLFSMYQPV